MTRQARTKPTQIHLKPFTKRSSEDEDKDKADYKDKKTKNVRSHENDADPLGCQAKGGRISAVALTTAVGVQHRLPSRVQVSMAV